MTVFNFPDTGGQPTDGSFVWTAPNGTLYVWDGICWKTTGGGSSGGGGNADITVTDDLTTISNPGQGDLAYHTEEARMYIYYEDDDSKQWVDASPGGDSIDSSGGGASQYWDRIGTTLTPKVSGDDVNIGTGDLTAADGTFTGEIHGGNAKQLLVQDTTGGIFLKDTGNATAQDWKIKLDSSGAAFFGSGNITFTTGGSASFAGDIQSTSQNGGQLAGFRNQLSNGDFRIWQRGQAVSTADNVPEYTADRWNVRCAGASQTVIQVYCDTGSYPSTVTQLPEGFASGIETNWTSAGGTFKLAQGVELVRKGDPGVFALNTQWTMSVWANFDLTAEDDFELMFRDFVGYATSADIVTAFTSAWVSTGETSNGYTRYKATGTISNSPAASATSAAAFIYFTSGSASGGGRRALTGAQLEPGPVATPFEHRPIQTELALCQRYYSRVQVSGGSYPGVYWDGSETYYGQFISFPVPMMALPNFVNFVSVAGNFMWVNPGQYGTSDPSTDGISFSFSEHSFALRQYRQGTGTAAPQPGYSYILEGAFTVEADAEL